MQCCVYASFFNPNCFLNVSFTLSETISFLSHSPTKFSESNNLAGSPVHNLKKVNLKYH